MNTAFGKPFSDSAPALYRQGESEAMSHRELCQRLERYYFSNGLYKEVEIALRDKGFWNEGIKPLRNPTSRVVEFHVSHVWPGKTANSFPVSTDNDLIIEPLMQLYKWSNWQLNKDLAVRWAALFGDMFIKVPVYNDKVLLQVIHPADVTELEHDERGNITYCRIDIQVSDEELVTEIWDKAEGTMNKWSYSSDEGFLEAENLPDEFREGFNLVKDFNIDFIPIAHGKCINVGYKRGLPAIWPSLDKIDELNRMVTTLHQRLFRYGKPTFAVVSESESSTGKPVPPPIIVRRNLKATGGDSSMEFDGERMVSLPGKTKLEQLIPNLNYSSLLEVANGLGDEIARDLPELKYSFLSERNGELSGRAIRLLLADAVDRVIQVRSGLDDALIRAQKMAFTIGQRSGIWSNIGDYENDELEHEFLDRPVISATEYEKAELTKLRVDSGIPLEIALSWEGKTEEQIQQVLESMRKAETERTAQITTALQLAKDRANAVAVER